MAIRKIIASSVLVALLGIAAASVANEDCRRVSYPEECLGQTIVDLVKGDWHFAQGWQ